MKSLLCRRCKKGNLMFEPDADGLIVDLKCLACGHSPSECFADELRPKLAPDDYHRAVTGAYPVWISTKRRTT